MTKNEGDLTDAQLERMAALEAAREHAKTFFAVERPTIEMIDLIFRNVLDPELDFDEDDD